MFEIKFCTQKKIKNLHALRIFYDLKHSDIEREAWSLKGNTFEVFQKFEALKMTTLDHFGF
jgi:hypothetical protein